jgi:predicted 2-oxoglutarate/Fe(II)-dependent dioxygenase YbiX
VDGVGELSLPLLPVQAEQLIALAERAPYGKGPATLVDTNVRRTWQIAPERVRFGGRHWQTTLERIVMQAAVGLGVGEPVSAQLYKLLIYDPGSFFVSHRDTEKAPGMFATLVLALPSVSSGGELVVRHKDREMRLDLANEDPAEMAYAAFYADCVHEVLPITSGYRVALVYNLTRQGKAGLHMPPEYDAEAVRLRALLREWSERASDLQAGGPDKVIYPLEHAYSQAELDFRKLKGVDAAVAQLLATVAPLAGCDLHVALLSISESGTAEYLGSYRRHGGRHDEFAIVEVIDREERLIAWRRPDGSPVPFGGIPFKEDEISPPNALQDMKPDEQHFHEATGNEGASFERTYRRAALVLWPQHRRLTLLSQAGPLATVPYVESLAAQWIGEGAQQDSALWREAHELSGNVLETWPGEAMGTPASPTSTSMTSRMTRAVPNRGDWGVSWPR